MVTARCRAASWTRPLPSTLLAGGSCWALARIAMRISFTFLLVALLGVVSAFGTPPGIPRTNEVVRYEREQPVFKSRQVLRARGDALLSALEGGQQIQERQLPPGTVCVLLPPERHSLSLTLTNGSVYRIGVSFEGGLVYLPEGVYEVTDAAQTNVAKVVSQLDEDLRREVVGAPRPVVYTVGMVDDGSTLSGIARLFYGDATKWRRIYEANRKLIKNSNVIYDGMQLTIPKL